MDIGPGDLIAGKYEVERVLGAGGMGVVVAARHLHLDTKVALKFLRPEHADNADLIARFAREARAAAKLTNEHVARVLDVGTDESGVPFMVMELLEGRDLSEWLRAEGPFPIGLAVDFILQACAAVEEAHRAGIIHRDLKPANLFCARLSDGRLCIKVLDFGVSKITMDASSHAITQTAALLGSPSYMSPEQMVCCKDVDGRTDVWALGVTLYQLLTGRRPFGGEAATEIAILVATKAPTPPRCFRPDLPHELEAALMKCLEKDREARYPDVRAFARAIAPFRDAHLVAPPSQSSPLPPFPNAPNAAPDPPSPTSAPPSDATSPTRGAGTMAPVGGPSVVPRQSARTRVLAGATLVIVLAIGVAGVLTARRPMIEGAPAMGRRPAPAESAKSGASEDAGQPARELLSVQEPAQPDAAQPDAAQDPAQSEPAQPEPTPPTSTQAEPARPDAAAPPSARPSRATTMPAGPSRPAPTRTVPSPVTSAVPSAAPAPDCSPKYYFDRAGRKHFKPECYISH